MGKHWLQFIQAPANELTVTPYVKIDQEEVVERWQYRFNRLIWFMGGPAHWLAEDIHRPEIRQYCEQQEQELSDEIFKVAAACLAGKDKVRILIVANGIRRVVEYLGLALSTGGECFGQDICPAIVDFLHSYLMSKGLGDYVSNFGVGGAHELCSRFEEESFDLITWERLGPHIRNDEELAFCLRQQVVPLLKRGGHFLLAESTKDLNPSRKPGPDSTFRNFQFYPETFGHTMRACDELRKETMFDIDRYVIIPFEKQ